MLQIGSRKALLYAPSKVAVNWWTTGGIPLNNVKAAYQPKGAASYAESKINLNDPGTNDAYEGSTVPWDTTNGWKFNRNQTYYLLTGLVPLDGWSMIVRTVGEYGSSKSVAGVGGADGERFYFLTSYDGSNSKQRGFYANSGATVNPGTLGTYMGAFTWAITPTGFYENGSLVGALSGTLTNARELPIGCYYRYSTYGYFSDADVYAFAIYDIDISSYIVDLTAAMQAL